MDWVKEHAIKGKNGALLLLYIQPGAAKTGLKGTHGSSPTRLKLAVHAPPVDGAANEAVVLWLSKALGISKSKIFILSGDLSRQKNIWIEGISSSLVLHSLK